VADRLQVLPHHRLALVLPIHGARRDDDSRYIIAWKLSPTMGATDVTKTLDQALAITGVEQVRVKHRPRLLHAELSSS
jgi:transposase InsO family protein